MKKRILSVLLALVIGLGVIAVAPLSASAVGFPTPPMAAGGDEHSLALESDGTVWAWGDNTDRQLGFSLPAGPYPFPDYTSTPAFAMSGVVAIASCEETSLALKSDGTVWGWGSNWDGELADGTNLNSNHGPKQILSGATAIAAGTTFALALKGDGTVWAWGSGFHGECGDGAGTQYNLSPVQVTVAAGVPLSGIAAISACGANCLALKNDSTVWGWGNNPYGEAGSGSSYYEGNKLRAIQSMAAQGVPLKGVVAVAAGSEHSLALKSDGTVWSWGGNRDGQLGDGTSTDRPYPVQVTTSAGVPLTGVAAIATGGNARFYSGYSLALKSDGTVWAWGNNGYGKLGDGTNTNRSRAVQVLSGAAAVAGSRQHHSLAVKNDGTVWAWGRNSFYQLGVEGGTDYRYSPVQVAGLSLGATTRVSFTAAQLGGASGAADSTGIQLTFSQVVSGLAADDITVFNSGGAVTAGTVTGSGTAWTIDLDGVQTQGAVTVRIKNFGTYNVTTTAQNVNVYKADGGGGTSTPWWVWLLIGLGGGGILVPIPFTTLISLVPLILGLVFMFI